MANKHRDNWIDCVKCIAIFVVMLNHSGLVIPGINFWGGMFFVPVFFILSGYTYHTREESFGRFLGRKAKRLLLPYITANAFLFVFFCVKDVLTGSAETGQLIGRLLGVFYARNQLFAWDSPTLFLPKAQCNVYLMTTLNSPTWFLPALFLTIVLFEALMRLTDRNGRKICFYAVLMLFMAILYHYLFALLLPWSLDAIPYFLMFFLWGYFLRRKAFLHYLDKHKWMVLVSGLFLILTALVNRSANYSIGNYGRSAVLALYNAIISSTIVFFICFKGRKHIPKPMAAAGRHTLFLLCYHLFAFAIVEMGWNLIPAVRNVLFAAEQEGAGIMAEAQAGILRLVEILFTMAFLTILHIGKEKLIHAKK